jgi:transposase InsO family protein
MDSCIESVCKQCPVCEVAKVRRQKLQSDFDALAPQAYSKPRQHYGMDFYSIYGGEILVIVDLFTRETILEWLPSRKQETAVQTIMRRVVFERGVPFSIRSDNAPELMKGIVKQLCAYLNITQIVTGGHNPRGNAICERANQTLGAMIRKLNDHE